MRRRYGFESLFLLIIIIKLMFANSNSYPLFLKDFKNFKILQRTGGYYYDKTLKHRIWLYTWNLRKNLFYTMKELTPIITLVGRTSICNVENIESKDYKTHGNIYTYQRDLLNTLRFTEAHNLNFYLRLISVKSKLKTKIFLEQNPDLSYISYFNSEKYNPVIYTNKGALCKLRGRSVPKLHSYKYMLKRSPIKFWNYLPAFISLMQDLIKNFVAFPFKSFVKLIVLLKLRANLTSYLGRRRPWNSLNFNWNGLFDKVSLLKRVLLIRLAQPQKAIERFTLLQKAQTVFSLKRILNIDYFFAGSDNARTYFKLKPIAKQRWNFDQKYLMFLYGEVEHKRSFKKKFKKFHKSRNKFQSNKGKHKGSFKRGHTHTRPFKNKNRYETSFTANKPALFGKKKRFFAAIKETKKLLREKKLYEPLFPDNKFSLIEHKTKSPEERRRRLDELGYSYPKLRPITKKSFKPLFADNFGAAKVPEERRRKLEELGYGYPFNKPFVLKERRPYKTSFVKSKFNSAKNKFKFTGKQRVASLEKKHIYKKTKPLFAHKRSSVESTKEKRIKVKKANASLSKKTL